MKDVVLTTDLYHRHADPNDHWNLLCMFALSHLGYIKLSGIMCDDDRAFANDGSFLHFGDPSVQSVSQLNFITGQAVPVGIGSRHPIKKREDLENVLSSGKKISSVTLLLDILERSKTKVDIHMCGSCKDVVIAYKTAPELFEKKCDCIYLNAGTYEKQDPLEYNVSLEPYAFSQIFKIPCNIRWSPCFAALTPPVYNFAKRANYYLIEQSDMVPLMSDAVKKYFNYMFGAVTDINWLTYLRSPLDTELLNTWCNKPRMMWSTPGFLLSAGKTVDTDGEIKDVADVQNPLYSYRPVNVKVTDDGIVEWEDTAESNICMFENVGADIYNNAMTNVVKTLIQVLPDIDL